jgi:CBS domain containing-hemolysin-like protein
MLGRAPEPGDEVEHEGIRFTVLTVEGSRIERLEIALPPKEPTEERLEEAS